MQVDDGLRGHQALADDQSVALPLQQLVQTGTGAVLQRVAVLDQVLVLRQTAVRHGLPVGGDPLLGAGEPGQPAGDADAPVAFSRQTAYTAVDGLEVGHADGGVFLGVENPVHQHHRETGGDQTVEPLEVVHGAGHQQTVHQTGGEEPDIGLLPLHIFPGVGDDQLVAVGREIIFHGFDHGGEEFIGDIGHNKADDLLLSGAEAAGGGVRRVSKLGDGPIDLFLCLVGDIPGIVDGVGYRGGGNPCQLGHIADGHLHETASLRNALPVYANN